MIYNDDRSGSSKATKEGEDKTIPAPGPRSGRSSVEDRAPKVRYFGSKGRERIVIVGGKPTVVAD